MIEWSNDEKRTVQLALLFWAGEETNFITNVKASTTLSVDDKERLLNESMKKIEKVKFILDKVDIL